MLRPFRLLEPTSVAEASRELTRFGDHARIYAGGAELLLLLRHGIVDADYLVSLRAINGLDQITMDSGILRIGARITHSRLEEDALVQQHLPMFAHAESQVANVRVRNQGTLAGNLCFNDPHSDSGTALLVYGAKVKVQREEEERLIDLEDFFVDTYTTALRPDEILTEIQIPCLPSGFYSSYLRIHRYQRPTLGVAAAVKIEGRIVDDARLAVGCIGPKPQRLLDLERNVRGLELEDAQKIIRESDVYLSQSLRPVDDLLGSADYKLYLARTLLAKSLEKAAEHGTNI